MELYIIEDNEGKMFGYYVFTSLKDALEVVEALDRLPGYSSLHFISRLDILAGDNLAQRVREINKLTIQTA